MDRAALSPLLRSFERHLRAENRSERTIASYLQSARQAESFLADRGISLTGASRADLEAFLGDLLGRRAAATAATRYKVLRILYRWLEEEDEVAVNPMAKMRPPIPWPCWPCWKASKATPAKSPASPRSRRV